MPRRQKSPPRGWHFWRRAFWTRPAILVLYGVLVGILGLVVLSGVPGDIRDAVAMRRAVECPASGVRAEADVDPPKGCLERVVVTLSGPRYSRGPGSDWHLLVKRDGHLAFYAKAKVPTSSSRRLTDDTEVEALLWEGTPVAIELPAGGRAETNAWGHRGWLLTLFIGMFAASGLPMLFEAARFKRRTTNGWWSVRGEDVGPAVGLSPLITGLSPLLATACVLAVPSMLGILPLAFGLPLQWAVATAVLGLALVVYGMVRSARATRSPAGDGRSVARPEP